MAGPDGGETSRASSKLNIIMGSAVSLSVFFLGMFMKEQNDVATITQRERDHHDEDEREFLSMQSQVDHRFNIQDTINRDRSEQIDRNKDAVSDINSDIAADKIDMGAVKASIATLKERYDQGRGERLATDDALGKRIDELTLRVNEIQRQVSVMDNRISVIQATENNKGRGK